MASGEIEVVELKDDYIVFTLSNVDLRQVLLIEQKKKRKKKKNYKSLNDYSVANALRRIMIAEVPTMGSVFSFFFQEVAVGHGFLSLFFFLFLFLFSFSSPSLLFLLLFSFSFSFSFSSLAFSGRHCEH